MDNSIFITILFFVCLPISYICYIYYLDNVYNYGDRTLFILSIVHTISLGGPPLYFNYVGMTLYIPITYTITFTLISVVFALVYLIKNIILHHKEIK